MPSHDVTGAPALRQARGREEIADALGSLAFPCSKQQLIDSVGDRRLRYDREADVTLAELVLGVPTDLFKNEHQARRAVDAQWARIVRNMAEIERGQEAVARRLQNR